MEGEFRVTRIDVLCCDCGQRRVIVRVPSELLESGRIAPERFRKRCHACRRRKARMRTWRHHGEETYE